MEDSIDQFKEKIESGHSFPGYYLFKFIIPQSQENNLMGLLPDGPVTFKPSSKGNYVSVTIHAFMPDSQSVVDIYLKAHQIEGLIAL